MFIFIGFYYYEKNLIFQLLPCRQSTMLVILGQYSFCTVHFTCLYVTIPQKGTSVKVTVYIF